MASDSAYLPAFIDWYSRKSPGWRLYNKNIGVSMDCQEGPRRSYAT
ncbi:MAG: hypothetical protein ACI9R8_001458, partial [Candidatus Paceibacteria bacterium]